MDYKDACEQAYQNGYKAGMSEKATQLTDELFITRNTVNALQGNIRILKANLDRLEAERDALLEKIDHRCEDCKHYGVGLKKDPCKGCFKISPHPYIDHVNWEWRGFDHDTE